MRRVLGALLRDPTRDDRYALELCRETQLDSGCMARVLFRLEQQGWVESRWEDGREANGHARPRRRLYRLTGSGERATRRLWQPVPDQSGGRLPARSLSPGLAQLLVEPHHRGRVAPLVQ